MFSCLAIRFDAWRARLGKRRALDALDGQTLADVGLSRPVVTAALAGTEVPLSRQPFD
jgi:uncharacterized protein YjiS (DUF1127 family)